MNLEKQRKLGLSLLPAPDHIDACNNPYELLNDLVNIAPLGTLTTTNPSATPPSCLLQPPEKCPNQNWSSECWSFTFTDTAGVLDLRIAFPLPVNLSEAQILFGGEEAEWPSNVTFEVSDNDNNDNDDDGGNALAEHFLLAPLRKSESGTGPGAWVSIPLKEPRLVRRTVVRIYKPKDSGIVHLYRVRLLEQCDVEMNEEDFNLEDFQKKVMEFQVEVPEMLKYCQSILTTQASPKTLVTRASAILRHFSVKEEKGLMEMPTIKELLANETSRPKIIAILDASLSHDNGLKLLLVQFDLETKTYFSPDTIPAFISFFNLPQYREMLLGDMFNDRADCVIRLALGVTTGTDGEDMLDSPDFKTLDTLPFEVLNWLLEIRPSSLEQGRNLRRKMVEDKAIHLVMDNFDRLAQGNRGPLNTQSKSISTDSDSSFDEDTPNSSSIVWAKGTGYGVGSCDTNSKSVQEVDRKKQFEEEKLICLLNILTNFVADAENESSEFLAEVNVLLKNSSLITVVLDYLRNDSVLDIAGHVPLYRVIFQLLSSMASIPQFWSLFIPTEGDTIILGLLSKLKNAVTTYHQLLQASNSQDWELIVLLHDIQMIAAQVEGAVAEFLKCQEAKETPEEKMETDEGEVAEVSNVAPPKKTLEDRYMEEMKKLQFAFMKMIDEGPVFLVPYHFENQARKNWAESGPRVHSRLKRLAQESATLSTSLPISYGSSIFVRCDNDRLDVIKVLITGPAGTPYSNGCFEFDVHFPLDYPHSPPLVNFETTGGKTIRFNPNLYECGKVCLSILNTWDGSPEERWNPKSSILLPVLVAIQSLILVDQPYWNEPGYEEYGGDEETKKESREYNANIRYYTLKYAILDQIKNHSPCFQEVIQRHFWIKKEEILAQLEQWEKDSNETDEISPDAFQETASSLKRALLEMTPPGGLEDLKFAT